jgi:hypothetical protein
MKKNAMLKIAAILMVAVLLTTCAISSTFAKYVTDGATVTETARVAKWGVTFTTKTNDLFLKTYDGGSDVSVASATKVVAPGTTNTASVSTDIVGTPEVAFKLITTATVDLGDGWSVGGAFYCPLVFKIGSGSELTSDGCADVAAFEKKINDAIKTAVTNPVEYAAKEYVETVDDGNAFSITWSWPFETGADASAKAANNVKDTALGDAAAAEVTITVTQTAEQIDTYTP